MECNADNGNRKKIVTFNSNTQYTYFLSCPPLQISHPPVLNMQSEPTSKYFYENCAKGGGGGNNQIQIDLPNYSFS